MSGGSFNYLYRAQDLEDLGSQLHELDEMACALAELGYAPDAAQETADLLARIRSANAHAQASTARLSEVWKAVELARWGLVSERCRGSAGHLPGKRAHPVRAHTRRGQTHRPAPRRS